MTGSLRKAQMYAGISGGDFKYFFAPRGQHVASVRWWNLAWRSRTLPRQISHLSA